MELQFRSDLNNTCIILYLENNLYLLYYDHYIASNRKKLKIPFRFFLVLNVPQSARGFVVFSVKPILQLLSRYVERTPIRNSSNVWRFHRYLYWMQVNGCRLCLKCHSYWQISALSFIFPNNYHYFVHRCLRILTDIVQYVQIF